MDFIEKFLNDLIYKYQFLEEILTTSNEEKKEFLDCLEEIYHSKNEQELKTASKNLLSIVKKVTEVFSEYYKPIVWTNSALKSKSTLKHAELMMYREGYSSDEYSKNADDVFKFLEDISIKMLLHKRDIGEIVSGDELWKVVYEEPSNFYGFLLGAELWLETMPDENFKRLNFSYAEKGHENTSNVSLSSRVFNDLLILSIKKLKDIGSSFDFFKFTENGYINFKDDSMGVVMPINISKIHTYLSNGSFEDSASRLNLLCDIFKGKSIEQCEKKLEFDSDSVWKTVQSLSPNISPTTPDVLGFERSSSSDNVGCMVESMINNRRSSLKTTISKRQLI